MNNSGTLNENHNAIGILAALMQFEPRPTLMEFESDMEQLRADGCPGNAVIRVQFAGFELPIMSISHQKSGQNPMHENSVVGIHIAATAILALNKAVNLVLYIQQEVANEPSYTPKMRRDIIEQLADALEERALMQMPDDLKPAYGLPIIPVH